MANVFKKYYGYTPYIGSDYHPEIPYKKSIYNDTLRVPAYNEFYLDYDMELFYHLKLLGVKILKFKALDVPEDCICERAILKSKNIELELGIPERYSVGFFKGLTDKIVWDYFFVKIKIKFPAFIKFALYYTNEDFSNFSQEWNEADWYDVQHRYAFKKTEEIAESYDEILFSKFCKKYKV